jgi:hypothetical protein
MSVSSRLSVLALLLTLAACGGASSSPADQPASTPGNNEPPANSSPCDVPLDDLGWSGALVDKYERKDYTPSEGPQLPFSTPSAGQVAKTVTKLIAAKLPVGGSVASAAIDLFWPGGDNGEIEKLLDDKIKDAIDQERLHQTLQDARSELDGLRAAATQYRGRIEYGATPEEQKQAWGTLEPLLDAAEGKFKVEEFRVELAGLYAQFATLRLLHLADGLQFLGTEWPTENGEIARVRDRLDSLMVTDREYLVDVYHDGLIRAGNAEAKVIYDEYYERSLSLTAHRLDQAQRLWTALNRFRRQYTLDVFDFSDSWGALGEGADPNARITREIYSDPVGYLPTTLPREDDGYFLIPKRAAPFGVDGSLMADVEAALPKYGLSARTLRLESYPVIYPTGPTSSGTTLYWYELPGLQWVTQAKAQTLGPNERLQRIDVTTGFDTGSLILFGNSAFRLNGRADPADAPVRAELRLPPYDPDLERRIDAPIEIQLCDPIVRVSGTSKRFIEANPGSASDSNFGGRYRSACSIDVTFRRRSDGAGEGVEIKPKFEAATNLYPASGYNYFHYTAEEAFDFAFPGRVLSNVITIDAESPLSHNQAVIFAFRRADSYQDK